jgi:hypothetical protein
MFCTICLNWALRKTWLNLENRYRLQAQATLISGGKGPFTHWIGGGLDVVAKRKICALAGNQALMFQFVASRDTT